jgi:glycosyltransferase involved in cell wall biosynthesis
MSAKRRVVFVVPTLRTGGAERQVIDLVNNLDRDRFEPTLFTFAEPSDLADAIARDRVRYVARPRQFKLDGRPVLHLARIIRDDRTALVHCTLQISLPVARAAILASGRSVPVISAIHTTMSRGWKEELANRLLYIPLMRSCGGVIAVCDAQRRYWAAKHPWLAPKMTTVHNGIDLAAYRDDVPASEKAELRRQLGIEGEGLVLGMVATIRPEKNHNGVLDAVARLKRSGRRAKVLFLGSPPGGWEGLEARLRNRTRELGLEEDVRWLGRVKGPKKVLSILDAAILFSTSTESLPLALLECLAMGKPVVSSSLGGIPEFVDHGKNGLLVPVGDVDAFAAALGRLASDPGFLRALSTQARPSIEGRFSVQEMARRTEAVMEAVLKGGGGPLAAKLDGAGATPPGTHGDEPRREGGAI